MDNFTKQPSEKFTINISYVNNISDETISSATVTAYLNDSDVTSTIIHSTSYDDDSVNIIVKAGTAGKNYKITSVVTTTSSNIFEKDVQMRVREE